MGRAEVGVMVVIGFEFVSKARGNSLSDELRDLVRCLVLKLLPKDSSFMVTCNESKAVFLGHFSN